MRKLFVLTTLLSLACVEDKDLPEAESFKGAKAYLSTSAHGIAPVRREIMLSFPLVKIIVRHNGQMFEVIETNNMGDYTVEVSTPSDTKRVSLEDNRMQHSLVTSGGPLWSGFDMMGVVVHVSRGKEKINCLVVAGVGDLAGGPTYKCKQ